MIAPGTMVRVRNPNHWLFDKRGYVVAATLETNMKRIQVGIVHRPSVSIPVDFQKHLHGWMDTPLQGERRVKTHACDGAVPGGTGYYMLETDLVVESDAPAMLVGRDGVGGRRKRH